MNENNQYLIAANSKSGQLIFGMFKGVDLIILGSGISVSIILFLIFQPNNLILTILILLPLLVCGTLVIPIPNYHNVLNILKNVYNFYFVDSNQLEWKGWCAKDEYK